MNASTDRRRSRDDADRVLAGWAARAPMRAAVAAMAQGRLGEAERLVRPHLQRQPADPAALCVLGDIAARAGVYSEAERLFRQALAALPLLTDAQLNLAKLLSQRDAVAEAIALLTAIAEDRPERWDVALFRLTLLGQVGEYEEANRGFEALVRAEPDRAAIWVAYGHLRNTRGDLAGSVAAYRRALALNPGDGLAWWGLADLKVVRLDNDDVAAIERHLVPLAGRPAAAAPLHFAAAKAQTDLGETEAAFRHYAAGNTAMRSIIRYDAAETDAEVGRSCAFLSSTRLAAAADGHRDPAPIFIVGLPRSGSTLVEQILASHSQIEGTAELPYVPMLMHRLLAERWAERDLTFPDVLLDLPPERAAALGRAYLDAAAAHRREGKPFFIDKLPNNWSYIGFIHLILPRATIIDARRAALACCWSCFRQWFARGQEFSYAFDDLGRYYRSYVRLLKHIDQVLPGRVHRVQHEALLADPEHVVRALLDAIGLPFENNCLRFHENDRPVRTASAQQVRRPIQRAAAEDWRQFEPWLGPLKAALGDLA